MKTKYENQVILYKRNIPSWDDADYSVDEESAPVVTSVIKTTAMVVTAPVKGAFLVLNWLADIVNGKEQ